MGSTFDVQLAHTHTHTQTHTHTHSLTHTHWKGGHLYECVEWCVQADVHRPFRGPRGEEKDVLPVVLQRHRLDIVTITFVKSDPCLGRYRRGFTSSKPAPAPRTPDAQTKPKPRTSNDQCPTLIPERPTPKAQGEVQRRKAKRNAKGETCKG